MEDFRRKSEDLETAYHLSPQEIGERRALSKGLSAIGAPLFMDEIALFLSEPKDDEENIFYESLQSLTSLKGQEVIARATSDMYLYLHINPEGFKHMDIVKEKIDSSLQDSFEPDKRMANLVLYLDSLERVVIAAPYHKYRDGTYKYIRSECSNQEDILNLLIEFTSKPIKTFFNPNQDQDIHYGIGPGPEFLRQLRNGRYDIAANRMLDLAGNDCAKVSRLFEIQDYQS